MMRNEYGLKSYLDLSSNILSGALPNFGASSVVMERISLNTNYFTGTLPDDWSTKFNTVGYIDAAFNQLSGTIPASWSTAVDALPPLGTPNSNALSYLRLNNNPCTCGDIPPNIWGRYTGANIVTNEYAYDPTCDPGCIVALPPPYVNADITGLMELKGNIGGPGATVLLSAELATWHTTSGPGQPCPEAVMNCMEPPNISSVGTAVPGVSATNECSVLFWIDYEC